MSLGKLKAAPILLIEDDYNKNILPLVSELAHDDKTKLYIFCYDNPASLWINMFKDRPNVVCHDQFNIESIEYYTQTKTILLIDSINQMILNLGWSDCLNSIKNLNLASNNSQLILVLHKDCIPHFSKLQLHLNHIANAIVSYDAKICSRIFVQIKKGGKIVRTEETLSYSSGSGQLVANVVVKDTEKEEEPVTVLPSMLSTFKIEVEQTEKLQKYNLKLPYMNKIGEDKSKVYYEPDAVDDWDEEDPDEDLDL